MAFNPSNPTTVEKAQQDPHCPWFLMGVTASWALLVQSTSSMALEEAFKVSTFSRLTFLVISVVYWDLNSALVKSAKVVNPRVKVLDNLFSDWMKL
jgi:hypothetical protein